jgi:hypothetical protein
MAVAAMAAAVTTAATLVSRTDFIPALPRMMSDARFLPGRNSDFSI